MSKKLLKPERQIPSHLAGFNAPTSGRYNAPNDREACFTLGAPELFGAGDDSVLEAVGGGVIVQSGFRRPEPASVAEIRLASIFRNCERYLFERSEVCPAWRKPFPQSPINSIPTLTTFLRTAIEQWSNSDGSSPNTEIPAGEKWRLLDNVMHTLSWFLRKGLIASLPDAHCGPRTTFAAGRFAAVLQRCLEELAAASATASGSTAVGQELPKRCSVILHGPTDLPIVLGEETPRLTQPQYEILKVLITAGEKGLSMAELRRFSGHQTAEKTLTRLAKKEGTVWVRAIQLPGAPNKRYRLLFL